MTTGSNAPDGPGAGSRQIHEYAATGIVITWEPARCQHSTNCTRGLPQVFDPAARPWIDPTAAEVEDLVDTIDRCPSHALGYRTDDGRSRVAPGG